MKTGSGNAAGTRSIGGGKVGCAHLPTGGGRGGPVSDPPLRRGKGSEVAEGVWVVGVGLRFFALLRKTLI